MIKQQYDIALISNYSDNLNNFHKRIATFFPNNIKYKIITYRRTNIENSYSFEEYLEENIDTLKQFDINKLNEKYKKTNLYLAVVCERLFVNYYSGIEKTLGNFNFSLEEINFLIKSFTLFLEPILLNSKIVFGGYADNFMSTLTFKICENYNKECYSFHPHWVVNNETCYINQSVFCKPVEVHHADNSKCESGHLENYNNKEHLKEYSKKVGVKKGLWGIFSPNIFDYKYIKSMMFGYSHTDKEIEKYLNLDRPHLKSKVIATFYRLKNKIFAYLFYKKINFKYDSRYKYVYFPLQFQPEASTGTRTPFLMNQLAIIENISKSLPLGYKLLVKEHYLSIGMYSKEFYKRLAMLPNVEVVEYTVNGKELLKSTDISIGYGGTTLFEAIVFGKKVILLAEDYIYCESKLVKRVTEFSNLKNLMLDFIDYEIGEDELEVEKNKMIDFFRKRGFSLYDGVEKSISDNLMWLSGEE